MQVYPEQSRIIHMDEPLGEVANAVRERELATRRKLGLAVVEEEIDELAMQTCIAIARRKLEEQMDGCALSGPDGFKHLLIHQRHLHKKGIMFTSFIFTMVITDLLGLEFVWSSDCKCAVCCVAPNHPPDPKQALDPAPELEYTKPLHLSRHEAESAEHERFAPHVRY